MTGPVQPVRLPATIGERWVSLPLLWPRHGTWRVWLVEGATSLALDARQVVAHLGIVDESVYVEFPIDWWHEYFDPRRPDPITLALWSHETVLRVAERFTPAGSRELMEFTSWVSAQFHGLCLEDPQRTLDESLPAGHEGSEEEFPVAAAARRLAVRYGAKVTRGLVFQHLQRLEYVERDQDFPGHSYWRTTPLGRSRGMVFARRVKHPKGLYEQVFVTQAGMKELSASLRTELEPPLVDLGDGVL